MVKAVFFDVGETLVDETRLWASVAEQHGVPALTLFGVLGGMIERRLHHRAVHDLLAPDRPLADWPGIEASDFYPDALPCLAACRAAGWRTGVAGNQPSSAERALNRLGLDVDVIAASETWGVEKPSPEFFARMADAAGCDPAEVAYVGDRVDNDVVPAHAAGMVSVFVVRGPWGWLQKDWPEAAQATLTVADLTDLPSKLMRLTA
jgi:HAD superfamily hydrolase (TIGR01509 family)